MKKSITILIPAYNEEKHLKNTVVTITKILKDTFKDYEILIFDDCSHDHTGEIADRLAEKNSRIMVIHNNINKGLGYNYKNAIHMAKKEFFGWIPGDNDIPEDSIRSILGHVGEADIIIPFTVNKKVRSIPRRLISYSYTSLLNLLFGLNLKYYNGPVIYKTSCLKKVKLRTKSFALQAEILIQLIKSGCTYREVPMIINGIEESKLFTIKNFLGILRTIIRLFFEKNLRRNKIL